MPIMLRICTFLRPAASTTCLSCGSHCKLLPTIYSLVALIHNPCSIGIVEVITTILPLILIDRYFPLRTPKSVPWSGEVPCLESLLSMFGCWSIISARGPKS